MRIALVSREFPPGSRSGGIGTYTEKTARALARLGQEVHVFTEGDPNEQPHNDSPVRLHFMPPIHARPDERRAVLRAWAVARALWNAGPFDVVQACEWDAEASVFALRAAGVLVTRLATPAYIVNRLNGLSTRTRVRTAIVGRMERMQARLSDHVISPSKALADVVRRDWRLDPARLTVVPTGIEMPVVTAGSTVDALRRRRYALFFGRLERRKGVKTWIDSLPAVLEQNEDLWAVFAGQDLGLGGMPVKEYARQALGPLMRRVVFLPRLPHSELFPLVAGATLVVMPSIWESVANACLEAMALGRPVIATCGSGFDEIMRDGVSGYLVRPDDRDELARVANRVLADRQALAEVGRAAHQRARDFDLDTMAARLLDLYADLVGTPGIRAAAGAA